MKNNKKYLPLIFLPFFLITIWFIIPEYIGFLLSTKERIANKVTIKVIQHLEKQGIQVSGRGSSMMYQITMLGLSCHYPKQVTLDNGRELLYHYHRNLSLCY